MKKTSQNLADNVLALRKKKRMTQAKLANIGKLTRASVALVESGSANPTLEVLMKLSTALEVSINELTSSPRAECKHIPSNKVPMDRRSKNGVQLRKLLPDKVRATEIDELQLKPRATLTGSPHVEGTREYFTCLEGQISIGILGQVFQVKKGDVLAFPGDKPHSYNNPTGRLARGISVVIFNP